MRSYKYFAFSMLLRPKLSASNMDGRTSLFYLKERDQLQKFTSVRIDLVVFNWVLLRDLILIVM